MDRQFLKRQLMQFFDQYQAGIDWTKLNASFDIRVLTKGECVFRQGESAARLYFINTGLVRYFSVSESGKEYTQTLVKAPAFIGSTRAMTLKEAAPFTIEALTDIIVISCTWSEFYAAMSQDLAFMQAYAKFLESIFIRKELKESSMVKHSATQRYLAFCKTYPELKNSLPKQQIASYIGITPVALSRIRAQIKQSC